MDNVVHFEIIAEDVDRAKRFYEKIFGWKFNDMPEMNYTTVMTSEVDEKSRMPKKAGVINGGMREKDRKLKNPVITIDVADIDESIEMIKKNGGKALIEKQPVGDMGFTAYFQDSEGNTMGLWQSAKKSAET